MAEEIRQRLAVLSSEKRSQLLERLESLRAERSVREQIRPVERGGFLPLSFAQERLWFLDQLAPGLAHHSVPLTLRLRPRLRVFLANVAADKVYRPRRYEGEITVIRAVESADDGRRWQRLSSRALVQHVVPGDHYSIFRPPHLTALVTVLRRCLGYDSPSAAGSS